MAEVKKYLDLEGLGKFWGKVYNDYIKVNADAIAQEVTDRQTAISNLETAYKAADSALETAYKAADEALDSKLTAEINKKVAQTAYDTKMGELDAEIAKKANASDVTSTVEGLNAEIAKKVAQTAYDTKMGELDKAIEDLETEVGKMASDSTVSELQGKVNTLIGSDASKSVRTIANEELAAQLLSGDADADFKTLQDLAAWLEDHPESAASMNEAIAANTKAIGDEVTRATGEEAKIRGEFAAADSALKGELNAEIAKKANSADVASTVDGLNAEIAKKVDQTAYDAKVQELADADSALDTRVKALEDADIAGDISAAVAAEAELRAAQDDKIEAAIGLNADGTHKTAVGNYISGATTIAGEISALDTQVKANADAIAAETQRATAAEAKALTDAKAYTDGVKGELTTAINGKVAQDAYDTKVAELAAADEALDGRLDAIETTLQTDYVTEAEWESRAITEAEILTLFA